MQAIALLLLGSSIVVTSIVGLFAGIIAGSLPNDLQFSQLPLSTSFSAAQPLASSRRGHLSLAKPA